jgi:putative N6-adenine-specific DNA methylase
MKTDLTRGGRKLEAALAAFGLTGRVRGASALGVGASTGGFVPVLLGSGAARVTAVDVGHGQLLPTLAADDRVTSLERTDFKTLSLSVAPGPFDFFTVDVSFVAGRSMLRGLAFRLRPGAEGVVLVKPQFELPSGLVKDGQVGAPALRKRALGTFAAKAEKLGFEVLATLDSRLSGGSGTVEILAHLRFRGRPDSMPRPGERKPGKAHVRQKALLPKDLRWFAVASPGLETALAEEFASLSDIVKLERVDGGVEFTGPIVAGMRANLESRIATRILLRMGEVRARDFAPLRRGLAKLSWSAVVPPGRPLRVDVSTSHCRLYHTGALADTLALAVEDCVGKLPASEKASEQQGEEDATRILLRGQNDRFAASIDSSGALLHRRGWRVEAGPAPLRETLAAGILALCGYDPRLPLVDPMCGSGTIAIEAAAMACTIAPGNGRSFAFERWPVHDEEAWRTLRGRHGLRDHPPVSILASDRDPRAVEIARRNAERASLGEHIRFAVAALGDGEVPVTPGLVVLNPPYGRRLGQRAQAQRLARSIGHTVASHYRNWRVAVLCPDASFVAALSAGAHRRPRQSFSLRNGGLRVQLAIWSL